MRKKITAVLILFAVLFIYISCEIVSLIGRGRNTTPIPDSQTQNTISDITKDPPVRFAVMADCRGSDIGVNTEVISKTLENIKRFTPQPSFAIMTGDLVGGAKGYIQIKAQMLHFKNLITKYYPIEFFYPGFGNHEATAEANGERAFKEVFPEIKANFLIGYNNTVYYFDKNNTRFYILNSDHPGEIHAVSDTQLDWINANSDPKKKHNLYFFHEPAYPTGAHIGSSLDSNRLQRDKLWEIIDHSKGPIAFCGHEHNYTRRHIDSSFNENINDRSFKFRKSVYQVTTGTFGAPLYNNYSDTRNVDVPPIPQYHYAIVDINKSKIKVTVYNLDGNEIDHFEQ